MVFLFIILLLARKTGGFVFPQAIELFSIQILKLILLKRKSFQKVLIINSAKTTSI